MRRKTKKNQAKAQAKALEAKALEALETQKTYKFANTNPGVPLDPPEPVTNKRKPTLCLMTHITLDAQDKAEYIKNKMGLDCLSDAIMDALDFYHASLSKRTNRVQL